MKHKGPKNPERSFGVSVGAVLLAAAAYFAWRGRMGRAEVAGVIGLFLLAAGLAYPPILKWPSGLWWRLAGFLGYVNSRILLTVLFALVLVPVGVLWRLIGKDPLALRRASWTGWLPYPERYRDHKHFQRMY
jgi:Saxitoxin biosynthesis operon protein SxtJ